MRGNPDRPDMDQAPRTEWRVRPARLSDRAFILGVTPRLTQGFELPPWRTAREVVEAESATLEEVLRSGAGRAALLVVEDAEGEPGGYVHVNVETDYFGRTFAHIGILVVSSEAEGHGAGRTLVAAAETWARSEGLDLISLNVFPNNARALALYQRLGYAADMVHCAKPLA